MKFLPLIWAGIWRKRGRAVLMLLQIVDRLTIRRDARVFTCLTRILLALAFIPSGLVKLQGELDIHVDKGN